MVTVAELVGSYAKGYADGADKLAEIGNVGASRLARMAAGDAQRACDAFMRSVARYSACLDGLTAEEYERFCEALEAADGRHAGEK